MTQAEEIKQPQEEQAPVETKKAKPAKKATKAKAKKAETKEEAPKKGAEETKAPEKEAKKAKASAEKPKAKSRHRWYVVQTQSNYEKRVQSAIREQAMMQKLEDEIIDVLIPTEEVVEVKKGVKSKSERKFFPGYVLVKTSMTDEVWHLLKNISHVTSFVGANTGNKPIPISNREAEQMLKQMEEGVETARPMVSFEVGEEVRVMDGPFNGFQGMVEEFDEERSRLKVSVSIFGRATPIELDFTQVEKC